LHGQNVAATEKQFSLSLKDLTSIDPFDWRKRNVWIFSKFLMSSYPWRRHDIRENDI
jgi:hypothetical protein